MRISMFWSIIVGFFGKFGNCAVAGVTGDRESMVNGKRRERRLRRTHPPNHTFFPPLSTLQLAHNVLPRSNGPRALVC